MHTQTRSELLDRLPYESYYEAIHKVRELLPPPLEETPEAYARRDRAVLNQIKQLVPVSAIEVELAAKSVACAEYGEGCLRLARQLVQRNPSQHHQLIAEAASMGRESRGYLASLLRAQANRMKREATPAGAQRADMIEDYTADMLLDALADPPGNASAVTATATPPPPQPACIPPETAPQRASTATQLDPPPQEPRPESEPAAADGPSANPPAQDRPQMPPRIFAEPSPARRSRQHDDDDDGWPKHDLDAEAAQYAIIYPKRARLIRRLGGLPANCDFGPPEPNLVRAIVSGVSPELLALDAEG